MWPEYNPNPPGPRPPNLDRSFGDPHPPPYSSSHHPYYSSNANPISLTAPPHSVEPHDLYHGLVPNNGIRRFRRDTYVSVTWHSDAHFGIESHARSWSYSRHHQAVEAGSLYYSDPISRNPVGHGAGVSLPSNVRGQPFIANPSFSRQPNDTARPCENSTGKKHRKKVKTKTKVVQSAHCEVCKIDCDTEEALNKHKLGGKHKKNLEKLNRATASAQYGPRKEHNIGDVGEAVDLQRSAKEGAEPAEDLEIKGQKVVEDGCQKSKRKAAEPVEDLETKRRKVLEGGTAAEAVRTCVVCNIVCNSETVFHYHLAGQKHAAMMRKHAAGTGVATAT